MPTTCCVMTLLELESNLVRGPLISGKLTTHITIYQIQILKTNCIKISIILAHHVKKHQRNLR